MEVVGHDVDLVEHIHVRSNVKDLLRLKSVCKSWYSLITSPRFIKLHLNHNYSEDRHNNHELGQRRILLTDDACHNLVGSSNGLVCVISNTPLTYSTHTYQVSIGNPFTREVVQLTLPRMSSIPLCWGFGYDSTIDDYKVIVATRMDGNKICVQAWSLKTNELRVIGEVNYSWFATEVGILCNGALHWIVRDENKHKIIAFNLAKEEFKEIPQPDDVRYEYTSNITRLGIVEDCLCIYRCKHSRLDRWIMKEYNVKQSWDVLLRRSREMKYDIVHYFSTPNFGTSGQNNCHWDYVEAHAFVQSLVSPHVNGRPKETSDDKRSAMLIKGDSTSPGPSARV